MEKIRKILIIDDDDSFLEETQEMLSSKGYLAFTANSFNSALDIVHAAKPDLILLDIKIGAANGFQLAHKFKQMPEVSHIPIIAMTGYFINDEHFLSTDIFNMELCLRKPFDVSVLTEWIESVLRKEEYA